MGVARQLPVNRVCVQLHCEEGAFANRILLLQLKPFQKKRESPGKFVEDTPCGHEKERASARQKRRQGHTIYVGLVRSKSPGGRPFAEQRMDVQ
jgi:hypothetical protein